MISAVIPVAGLGTRALPASKTIPKEMMPLYDRPIIQYVVEEASASGISNLILVTSKGKSSIEDHFDISPEIEAVLSRSQKKDLYNQIYSLSRKVNVQTVRQKEPLGLGHAVLTAKNLISDSHFAVLLGDDVIEGKTPGIQQLMDFCSSQKAKASKAQEFGAVLLMEVPASEVSKYGICEMQGERVVHCVEKPKVGELESRLAIIGRYFLPKDIFEILERQKPGAIGEIQLTDALNVLAKEGRLFGVVLQGQRFDAGDRLGFLKANLHYYLKSPLQAEVKNLLKETLGL